MQIEESGVRLTSRQDSRGEASRLYGMERRETWGFRGGSGGGVCFLGQGFDAHLDRLSTDAYDLMSLLGVSCRDRT